MVTAPGVPFKGARGGEKALMSIKISTIATPFLAMVFVPPALVGCKPASPSRQERGKAQKEQQIPAPRRAVPREELLLQLVFTLGKQKKTGEQRPVSNAGCQLHLLRDSKGALQVAADIGDLRRRTVYPQKKGFQRLPTYFPFGLDKGPLMIELHTSINDSSMTRIPLRPRQGKLIELPIRRPERWAFSCVIRQKDGPGVAIEGMFYGDKPRVFGNRGLSPQTALPAAMQQFMKERVAR